MNKLSIFLVFACLLLLARSEPVMTFAQFNELQKAEAAPKATEEKAEAAPKATEEKSETGEATTPEVTTPEATEEKSETGEATTPEVTTPESTEEKAETGEATTPEATTPESTEEKAETGEATTPEATEEKAETGEATDTANEGAEATPIPSEPVNEGAEATPIPSEPANEGAEATPIPSEPANEGAEATPIPSEPANEGAEATPIPSEPANEGEADSKATDEAPNSEEKEVKEMNEAANIATQHATQMEDLSKKLDEIKELYQKKADNDRENMARQQLRATHGVMHVQEHALAPQRDVMFPLQMPRPGHLLNRFRIPPPTRPQPSLYFNRPGRPTKLPTYLEADSDHKMYPDRFYPATPSRIERTRFLDRLERARSVVPNYRYIAQKERQALMEGKLF